MPPPPMGVRGAASLADGGMNSHVYESRRFTRGAWAVAAVFGGGGTDALSVPSGSDPAINGSAPNSNPAASPGLAAVSGFGLPLPAGGWPTGCGEARRGGNERGGAAAA